MLITGSLNAAAAPIVKITACDPCGTVDREHAAKSVFNWNQSGEVYVADFYIREGFKYNVYIDYIVEGPDQFPIHKTNLVPLNPAEQEAFNDLFALYDSLKSAIQNNSSSNNKVAPSLLSTNAAPFELGTVKIIHPAITVHDFLSNSQMRNNM